MGVSSAHDPGDMLQRPPVGRLPFLDLPIAPSRKREARYLSFLQPACPRLAARRQHGEAGRGRSREPYGREAQAQAEECQTDKKAKRGAARQALQSTDLQRQGQRGRSPVPCVAPPTALTRSHASCRRRWMRPEPKTTMYFVGKSFAGIGG